jgi:hypothetical protein
MNNMILHRDKPVNTNYQELTKKLDAYLKIHNKEDHAFLSNTINLIPFGSLL